MEVIFAPVYVQAIQHATFAKDSHSQLNQRAEHLQIFYKNEMSHFFGNLPFQP